MSSFFNILAVADIFKETIYGLLLVFDAIIYRVVSYSFRLFILISKINFNSIYGIISPLVDRATALIMVFVAFKLAVAMIQAFINPENAPKAGKQLILNIIITAALLVSYNFIFRVFNEMNMFLIGTPGNYEFTTLSQLANISGGEDSGLVMRFIFGDDTKVDDVGDFVAYNTLGVFLRDKDADTSNVLKETIVDGDTVDYDKLTKMKTQIGKTVEFTPILPGIIGIYMIFCVVKSAIEMAVRVFKLIVLQLLAPLAIISIIGDGLKSSTFTTFYKKYIGVYIEAAIRLATMLLTTVLISKFIINIGDYVSDATDGNGGLTKMFLMIIVIVAAFKFSKDLPKFIEEALGKKFGTDSTSSGFGSFVGGLIGGGAGLISGGVAAGVAGAGAAGVIGNALVSGYKGAGAGAKGNSIAEKIKAVSESNQASRDRATKIARQGGGFPYLGQQIEHAVGIPQAQAAQAQRYSDAEKALDNMVSARQAAIAEDKSAYKDAKGDAIKFGTSSEDFANKVAEYDDDVIRYKTQYEAATDAGVKQSAYTEYLKARESVKKRVEKEYYQEMFNDAAHEGLSGATVKETTTLYENAATSDLSIDHLKKDGNGDVKGNIKRAKIGGSYTVYETGADGQQHAKLDAEGKEVTVKTKGYQEYVSQIKNKGASRRANRQGRY